MRLSVPLLVLAAACAEDPTPLDGGPLPPPGALTLTHTPLVTGELVTVTVSGALPGNDVYLFRAPRVQVGGYCPGPIRPTCLDLATPVSIVTRLTPDPAGVASVTFRLNGVPAGVASVAMQAGSITPSGVDTSNAVTAPIYAADSDTDSDGLTAADEVRVHGTDPGQPDSDNGGAEDGVEVVRGTDPAAPSDDGGAAPVTWSADIDPLLTNRCSGCHVNGASSGGLNLDQYSDFFAPSAQSNLDLVQPGDPLASYLWHKLSGTQTTVGGSGGRMPLGRTAFNATELRQMRVWIATGAPQ